MPPARRHRIADALRQRLLQGLSSGALREGDRLPSTRELATELAADQRVVAAAYRRLAADGLVEMRPRSGVFVAALPGGTTAGAHGASPTWLAQVIADAVREGVSVPALAETFASVTNARRLTASVIARTLDQALGITRELREHFGLDARGYLGDELRPGETLPRAIQRTHLLVGTELTVQQVTRLAERLRRPHLIISVRPDLLSPEWRFLLKRVTFVVVADPRFASVIHGFFDAVEGAHNIRILVAGRDDLSVIPPDAATYVTDAARTRVGRSRLPGRLIAPARTLSEDCARAIADFIVAENLAESR